MLEQELKLTARNSDDLIMVTSSSLIKKYCIHQLDPKRFFATYLDTQNRQLGQRFCSLRSRQEGEVFKAALKMRGTITDGMSSREEIECDLDSMFEQLDSLPEGALKSRILDMLPIDCHLIPWVTVDMQRQIFNLDINGTLIEMVADQGQISANGKSKWLYEIELELKSGTLKNISDLGDEIRRKYNLVPSVVTKHQIGIDLWIKP